MKKYFYRIGHKSEGLWYDKNGNFTGRIHTEEFKFINASELQMPFETKLVNYISVADSLEHLYQWFTKEEILILQKKGFNLEEWIAEDWKFYDFYKHNVINKETSILNNIIYLDYERNKSSK